MTLGFWMDGKLLATQTVETKPSGLVYFNPYSEEELRLYLPEGDHVFRAGFIDDEFVKTLPQTRRVQPQENKFLDSIIFVGPFASTTEKESRKKILTCDPESGRACVERDRHRPGAPRLPPSADARAKSTRSLRFVDRGEGRRSVRRAGHAARHPGDAGVAAISSSASSAIPIRAIRRSCTRCRRSSSPRASATSCGARCPTTSCWRSPRRASCATPRVLEAQVKRMLADPRASAFAANFAGQWLETRNLDVVKPDPDKFKEWDPELRDAMKTETTMFFEHVLRENRPVSEFLDANYTFLNERLATHYGIDGVTRPGVPPVELTTDRRGGVLSQAGVLTVSSYPTRTSPVIRGKYVLQNILGIAAAAAAGRCAGARGGRRGRGAIAAPAAGDAPRATRPARPAIATWTRSASGWRTTTPSAAGATWTASSRSTPAARCPTASASPPPAEMRALLVSQLPQFSRTLTEKMLTYALRRGLKPYDRRTVDGIHRAVAADGYHFQTHGSSDRQELAVPSPRRGEDVSMEGSR